MMAADSVATLGTGGDDGEDNETAAVDEGRRADAQDARAREDKDNCDRAQIEAQCGGDVSESNETWCDARSTVDFLGGSMAVVRPRPVASSFAAPEGLDLDASARRGAYGE